MSKGDKTEDDKGVPAKVLHVCEEYGVTLAALESDGPRIIQGHHLKEGQAMPPGASLFALDGDPKGMMRMRTLISGDDRSGPARVTNAKYRAGYDEVFGPKKTDDRLLN